MHFHYNRSKGRLTIFISYLSYIPSLNEEVVLEAKLSSQLKEELWTQYHSIPLVHGEYDCQPHQVSSDDYIMLTTTQQMYLYLSYKK